MLDNGDKTIGSDGCANLYPDSVLSSSPEFLDFEVLFEPLEEQFNLPAVLVEFRHIESLQMECVGQKCKLTVLFFIVESDKPKLLRILLNGVNIRQLYNGICQHILGQTSSPLDALVLQVLLGADDKV